MSPTPRWRAFLFSKRGLLVLFFVVLFSPPVYGKDEPTESLFAFEQIMKPIPNVASFSVGFDSARSSSMTLDSDLRLPNDYRLLLSGGSNSSDLEDETLKTGTFRLGISSDPMNEYQGTLSFEHWGVKDELERQSFSGTVARWGKDWNVQGSGVYRQLHLITDHPTVQNVDVVLHSPALAMSVQYMGWGAFGVRLSAEKYWYNIDMGVLNDSWIDMFFSPETLSLSSSFLDYSVAIEIGYQFKKLYLGVEGSQNRSAIDDSRSQSGTLLFSIDLPKGLSAQLQGGRSIFPDNEDSPDVTYTQAGLSYTWSQ